MSSPTPTPRASAFALEARGMHKRFGGTYALQDASLYLRPGTVHALLGGNGSGKSTVIKCLTGVYRADSGEVSIFGDIHRASDLTPSIIHHAGIRVVHQDLGLFDRASIAENFAFDSGFPTSRLGSISWSTLNRRVKALLEEHNIAARHDDLVGALRPAQKTLVAIARALQDQRGREMILLLDEPTASLPEHESRLLLEALRERAAQGQTIALVTHRMHEVLAVADDATVFRDGRVAGSLTRDAIVHETLVSLLTGGILPAAGPALSTRTEADVATDQPPLLEIQHLACGPLLDVNLTVRRGEVVGVAGLLGSGRSTLLNSVFGVARPRHGNIELDGKVLKPGRVGENMHHGIAMVPENRLRDAAFPTMSVRENASASVLRRFWSGWMRTRRERVEAQDLVRHYSIKTQSVESGFTQLSGGNQQKVILARWMRRDPRLLLLDEPTQGVDVVARTDIYTKVSDAARHGCGVLVASSDHDELATLCDRVLILGRGIITSELLGDSLTPDAITREVQSLRLTPEPQR